jgi:hypothetical protein
MFSGFSTGMMPAADLAIYLDQGADDANFTRRGFRRIFSPHLEQHPDRQKALNK